MSTARGAQVCLAVAGMALGVLAYRVQMDNLPTTTEARSAAGVVAAWSFLLAGLVAWARRPRNPLGPLMVATCFALLARQYRYSHDEWMFTLAFLVGELGWVLVAHVSLAYPFGRVTDRLERAFLFVAYVSAVAFPLAVLLVYDGGVQLRYVDPFPRTSALLVAASADLADLFQKAFGVIAYGVLALVFLALVARKLVAATPRARRVLLPLLLAAVVAAFWALLNGLLTFAATPPEVVYDLFWWQVISLTALPLALLWGLLRARLARAHVSELVVHLERSSRSDLRDELAAALEDPTLEVAFWLPERQEFVDPEGRPYTVPEEGRDHAVTRLEQDGEPLAVLVHDSTLLDEPKLVEAVAAAARLALQNARLHAEVSAQLEEVKRSRSRIATAASEERRRIERDLHDGAQQRLVALALELRSAQRRLGDERDPRMEDLLASASEELRVAVEELRALAQGIHPGILTQGGLAPALESLASRMPFPVSVDAAPERLPAEVEATAYFVACEALANVAKHADASQASISARRRDGLLVVEVSDDGAGGAEHRAGTGLRGLEDRVEAQGGRLLIESTEGSGTRIVGEIPCAS